MSNAAPTRAEIETSDATATMIEHTIFQDSFLESLDTVESSAARVPQYTDVADRRKFSQSMIDIQNPTSRQVKCDLEM